MPEKRRQNLAEADRGSYYSQQDCLEEFLDDKGAFYNGIAGVANVTTAPLLITSWSQCSYFH